MKRVLILEYEDALRTELDELIHRIDGEAVTYITDEISLAYQAAMTNTIDLYIIDAALKRDSGSADVSGIMFAEGIRRVSKYGFTPIIFIADFCDSKFYAYTELHCYSYFEKPFDKDKFESVVREAMKYSSEREENRILFCKEKGVLQAIKVKEIMFARSFGKDLEIVTREQSYCICYKTCKEFMKEVDSNDFLQCNRSTIVNRRFVKSIDAVNRYLYLENNSSVLEIGSTYKKEFLSKIKRRI